MKLSDVFNHFKSSVTCWSGGEMSSWDGRWVHTGFYSKKVRQFFSEQTVLQTFAPDTLSKMTLRLSVLYRCYPDHISYWEHCTWHTWYHSFSQHWFHGPISQCNLHLTDTNLICVTMRPFPHCKFTPCLSKGLTATRVTQTATGTRFPSRVADGWCHALAPAQALTAPLRHAKPRSSPLPLRPRLLHRWDRPSPAARQGEFPQGEAIETPAAHRSGPPAGNVRHGKRTAAPERNAPVPPARPRTEGPGRPPPSWTRLGEVPTASAGKQQRPRPAHRPAEESAAEAEWPHREQPALTADLKSHLKKL